MYCHCTRRELAKQKRPMRGYIVVAMPCSRWQSIAENRLAHAVNASREVFMREPSLHTRPTCFANGDLVSSSSSRGAVSAGQQQEEGLREDVWAADTTM